MSLPLLRIIKTRGENLVIICDRELLGKKFKEGKFQIEVKESFYAGREASVDECLQALRNATIANMVGSIVDHAIKEGIVDKCNVIKIKGVTHAQLVRL
ncbi:MAG: hypothetical protein APZ16_05750 [Candidatus Hadarchaeum yellowstonense]|uniref:DUF424 domain-containing protein n=1 Tax=Hadarchaeum yellowstonense TaxID=1776334 RepID=A0A147JX06_HADYE|nr:MAG: hypothetical protein APZ16_05750 [Candidatus Hadarchaeum yellowstonense]